jgi:hypothetical protein
VKVKVAPPDRTAGAVGEILILPDALAGVMPSKNCESSKVDRVRALRAFFML